MRVGQPWDNAWDRIKACERRTLTELFAADGDRVGKLSARLEWGDEDEPIGALFDWSKTHLDDALLDAFEALAYARDFAGKRAALLVGERVNVTEPLVGPLAAYSALPIAAIHGDPRNRLRRLRIRVLARQKQAMPSDRLEKRKSRRGPKGAPAGFPGARAAKTRAR